MTRLRFWMGLALVLTMGAVAMAGQRASTTPQAVTPAVPKLVVILVVDQMRADYVDRYGDQWSDGLKRLVADGAVFRRAAFPYAATVTCVGHATISTGAFPAAHGIVGNSWFDKGAWKSVACADQPTARPVSYGGAATGGYGPDRLLLPTLADELRAQGRQPTRVVTMSMKPRTAIMLAGRRADAVTWFNADAGGFMTSSYYTAAPVPFVAEFVRANPIDAEFASPWVRALPVERYRGEDDGLGESPEPFWSRTFPHAFAGSITRKQSFEAWGSSPRADAYLGRMAVAAIDALKLGQGSGTDFLGISFSVLDSVGHAYGPDSHEVQDVLVQLDRTLGMLLNRLDATVGRGRYVVGLSADHGVAAIPESNAAKGLDAGRVLTSSVMHAVQGSLQRTLGFGEYKVRLAGTDLHLETAVLDRVRATPGAADALVRALRSVPGIANAYAADALDIAAAAGDRDARALLASHHPGRSGDFVVYPKPHWLFASSEESDGTGHGLPYAYDQRVPLVLYGAGIQPGVYVTEVTPADLAPTMALLSGVTLARPDGRPLVEALAK